jgi:hypothetical protein
VKQTDEKEDFTIQRTAIDEGKVRDVPLLRQKENVKVIIIYTNKRTKASNKIATNHNNRTAVAKVATQSLNTTNNIIII